MKLDPDEWMGDPQPRVLKQREPRRVPREIIEMAQDQAVAAIRTRFRVYVLVTQGYKLKEIAQYLNVSTTRVRQIRDSANRTIRNLESDVRRHLYKE